MRASLLLPLAVLGLAGCVAPDPGQTTTTTYTPATTTTTTYTTPGPAYMAPGSTTTVIRTP